MNEIKKNIAIAAVFSTIFINIDIGFFNNPDMLKLAWLYIIAIPIVFIKIIKDDIRFDKVVTIPIIILTLCIISALINNNIQPFLFHDLGVGIVAIIFLWHFKDSNLKDSWEFLFKISVIASIFIFIYSVVLISILKYNEFILFGNRNLTANFLAMTTAILSYGVFTKRNILKIFSVLAIILNILSIHIYFPRRFGLILSIVSLMGCLVIYGYKINRRYFYIILTIILAISMTAILKFDRFNELFTQDGYDDRLIVLKIATKAILDKIFFGYGLGATSFVIDNYRVFYIDYSIKMDEIIFSHVHNEPLQYLLEGGVFAFSFYLFFIYLIFNKVYLIFFSTKVDASEKAIAYTLFIAIIIGILHSSVDVTSKSPFNRVYLFMLIGLLFSINLNNKNSQRNLL
jgi:O-antigen ligase